MTNDVELGVLKQQRTIMKRNITNLKGKIDKCTSKTDSSILECQMQILESYYEQITTIQTQIEKVDASDNHRSEIEDSFIAAKSKLLQFLNKHRPSAEKSILNSSSMQHANRLPKLKLPKFSGNYIEFSRFIHTFETLVDDETSITQIDKFNYLLECLTGAALAVVEPFQVNEENYERALNRLKERFDNKTLIFIENIKALFSLPSMEKGNPASLRALIDKVASVKGSLLTIGTVDDVLNAMFTHLTVSKLDAESSEAYAEKQDFKKLPTFDDCYDILCRRCQYLESCCKLSDANETTPPKVKHKGGKSSKSLLTTKSACTFCQSTDHTISRCNKFEDAFTVQQRIDYATQNALCKNCLTNGHSVSKCPSKYRCRQCKGSHHTKLHLQSANIPIDNASTQPPQPSGSQPATTLNAMCESFSPRPPSSFLVHTPNRALIPTAVVLIKDSFGIFQHVRAILDSGSEVNLITEETAKRLGLQQIRKQQLISGIGNADTNIKFEVEGTVRSRISSFEWTSRFAAITSISNVQPSEYLQTSQWICPHNIEFADPLFYKPHKVDLLISSEIFFDLLLDERISLGENKPSLIKTTLGWIVSGKFQPHKKIKHRSCNIATFTSTSSADNFLKKFWELEEYVQPSPIYSNEEERCETHYVQHSTFAEDGRVQVRLPFKGSISSLGDSFQAAKRRFSFLERRLERNEDLKQQYVNFMDEYEKLGHMSPISTSNLNEKGYFIPHHPVLRPESTTTKLRVVFDASAKTTLNTSLNELLMVGPTIQQDIITTLLAFRLHRYALIADIRKMYRQFWVHKADRKFQRILWRSTAEKPLQCYELNTVTYGTSAAPFLAVRSLFFIADTYQHRYPLGAQILKRDFYVDDVLTGADTVSDLRQIKGELTDLLALAKLELTKWNSNNVAISESNNKEVSIDLADDVTKALGLAWQPLNDEIRYKFNLDLNGMITKRTILSTTAQIFDILGLLSPVIIRCKILLQRLWIARIDWDAELPPELSDIWVKIRNDLPLINNIKIPRYVMTSPEQHSEIHGFADASQQAYGCCIYVRVWLKNSYKTTLLLAKSKVAPVKAQSLPRLELCAAALLARTWHKFQSKVAPFINQVYFWTDSKTVLLWLKQHSSTLNTFVGNRVSDIQSLTEAIPWRHCPTNANPADIVSRGCSAKELSLTKWFNGPEFLLQDSTQWPYLNLEKEKPTEELRKSHSLKCSVQSPDNIIENIIKNSSSYQHILRIVAYMRRVCNKVKADRTLKETRNFSSITTAELDDVFHLIISVIQHGNLAEEFQKLKQQRQLSPSYQKLAPFLCERTILNQTLELLHVGGRLSKAPIPIEAKFPLLMPNNHRFITLYIEHLHRQHLHAGTKILIGLLRQRIWILNARQIVSRVVRNCVHCFKYHPKLAQQIMSDLPEDRFKDLKPFLISGVDFCGPIMTSYRIRSKVPYKTYVAIFVCFASKAVHIELASDLSSDSFIGCLKRFVSRRGIPQKIYCDNATNFAGANNKLRDFFEKYLSHSKENELFDLCAHIGFQFRFIPPRSPHFGGLWEAAVKSAKRLIMKHIAQANLSFEELLTVTTEVEAILNSRPLTAASHDPNDGDSITPSHLIGGFNLLAIPEPKYDPARSSSLSRWQRITFLKQQFWKQWLRDYVLDLQARSKWLTEQTNIHVGQIVLIHDENIPPQQWIMARIIKVFPGADGRIRVAEVKTSKGILRRAIQRLAPLPILS